MKNNNKSKILIITPYMEQRGQFVRLEEHDGVLLAEIAKQFVVLPIDLKDALAPHLGERIAVLRTDIPGKEYLFRILPENNQESGGEIMPMNIDGLCENEQILNCEEVI
jgi:hypothetical protein